MGVASLQEAAERRNAKYPHHALRESADTATFSVTKYLSPCTV
jgi:hypothetical protein